MFVATELPDEIFVDGVKVSPIHHSCKTDVAPEKVPGVQDTFAVFVLAIEGIPSMEGEEIETGLLGWLTVRTLFVEPFAFVAVTVQIKVLELPELFSETDIDALVEPNGTPVPLQAILT